MLIPHSSFLILIEEKNQRGKDVTQKKTPHLNQEIRKSFSLI